MKRDASRAAKSSPSLQRAAMVALGAVFLCAPAVYNGFPLLYFDSFDYLDHGYQVVDRLTTGAQHAFYGYRSPFFSLFLGLLHATRWLWLVPLAHGLMLSYVLFLCFRIVTRKRSPALFVGWVAVLSFSSSAPWFVSFVMPDIFAAILILAAFLLGPCRDELAPAQVTAVLGLALFSMLVHASHVALGLILAVATLVTALMESRARHGLVSFAILGSVVGATVLLTLGMSAILYGHYGFYRFSPPFLLARSIGDGPGLAFIRSTCVEPRYAICAVADQLPTDSSKVLWGERSIASSVPPSVTRQIKDEELTVVLAAIRKYPLWQLGQSLGNFVRQLTTFDLDGFGRQPSYDEHVSSIMPSQHARYAASRQHDGRLPLQGLTVMQGGVFWLSLLLVAWLSHRAWRSRRSMPLELAGIVAAGLLGNAFITGVLSSVQGRYQSRVAWLAMAVASMLCAAEWCRDGG